tara:strand:- start:102 stop:323 length:222 start_codon:yes stop_codon:yes gene_type:complete
MKKFYDLHYVEIKWEYLLRYIVCFEDSCYHARVVFRRYESRDEAEAVMYDLLAEGLFSWIEDEENKNVWEQKS